MTIKQKQTADFLIKYFKKINGGPVSKHEIYNSIDPNIYIISDLKYLLHFLVYKDFLKITNEPNKENFFLTDKGWAYESLDNFISEENRRSKLEEALITSSISANKSSIYINGLFWITAIFSIIAAIGTFGSFILELNK